MTEASEGRGRLVPGGRRFDPQRARLGAQGPDPRRGCGGHDGGGGGAEAGGGGAPAGSSGAQPGGGGRDAAGARGPRSGAVTHGGASGDGDGDVCRALRAKAW